MLSMLSISIHHCINCTTLILSIAFIWYCDDDKKVNYVFTGKAYFFHPCCRGGSHPCCRGFLFDLLVIIIITITRRLIRLEFFLLFVRMIFFFLVLVSSLSTFKKSFILIQIDTLFLKYLRNTGTSSRLFQFISRQPA